MSNYYNRTKWIADTMAAIGSPLGDDKIVSYVPAGLGDDYENFTTSMALLVWKEDFTLCDLYGHMTSYKAHTRQSTSGNYNNVEFHHSANNTSRGGGRGGIPRGEADMAAAMAAATLIYVDDIIITGSWKQVVSTLMQKLRDSFAVKDLEKLSFLLSVSGIALTHAKYAANLLRYEYAQCSRHRHANVILGDAQLVYRNMLTDDMAFGYRSTVGALQYLCQTRPDISFAVN
jgi:hypothetical protein